MNKILNLFDEKLVSELLTREALPHLAGYSRIRRVEINPYKKLVWETTYHVVIGFDVYLEKNDGREEKVQIVCSAHSSEPRENIYQALKYLDQAGFAADKIDIPEPLFYSDYYRGIFYRGLEGDNLLHYIKEKDFTRCSSIVKASAELFARLHSLPAGGADFNPLSSRIETVIPGAGHILEQMADRYGSKYQTDLSRVYQHFISCEDSYFNNGGEKVLIHGDAHPENILATGTDRIGLIDFTDMCRADRARDVGSFLQQLEYKVMSKTGDNDQAQRLKKLFLENYLEAAKLELTDNLQERISLYYNWTAIRTATFWFLKDGHNEERAAALLKKTALAL